jgi:hypothetical protein
LSQKYEYSEVLYFFHCTGIDYFYYTKINQIKMKIVTKLYYYFTLFMHPGTLYFGFLSSLSSSFRSTVA